MTATTLPKDPAPGITPTPAVEIRTDVWNQMVDILNGVDATERPNLVQFFASKTASYTATIDDFAVMGDATGAAFTITLPSAAATGAVNKILAIKKIDSSGNKVTIDGNGIEEIDGKLTIDLETENEVLIIQSDGTNWVIIASYLAVIDNGLLKIRNPAGTFSVAIKTSAEVANRSATIPLIAADDTFVMVNLAQNLRAKQMYDSNGNEVLLFVGVASALNHLQITNAATGNSPILEAVGDNANIGITITPKGTGIITALNQTITNIREATGNALAVVITAIASAVNYIEVKANITANDPEIQAKGSDTNVGIKLVPKGTGLISADNFEGTGTKRIEREITTTTVALDLTDNDFQTISITANTTFTTSNRASGRSKTIRIINDSTLHTFTFPAWKFVGPTPADIGISKTGILTITAFGTADTDIIAAYAVEE